MVLGYVRNDGTGRRLARPVDLRETEAQTIRETIEDERRLQALVARAARPPLRTVDAALLRDLSKEIRDQARILLRHLRDLTGSPRAQGQAGRFPRNPPPLGKTEPLATLREAPSLVLDLITRYRDLLRTVEDRYLRGYLRVLIENRLDLCVQLETIGETVKERSHAIAGQ